MNAPAAPGSISPRRAALLAFVTLALCVLATTAHAETPAERGASAALAATPAVPVAAVPWSSLSVDQQRLLARFEPQWNQLAPGRQNALARGSARWLAMSPERRALAKQRFSYWQGLSDDDRERVRRRWRDFSDLPPEQQEAVRNAYRKFQQLPPERRRELRRRWDQATPAQRSRMLERLRERQLRRQRQP
jgi:hypothetical protein